MNNSVCDSSPLCWILGVLFFALLKVLSRLTDRNDGRYVREIRQGINALWGRLDTWYNIGAIHVDKLN